MAESIPQNPNSIIPPATSGDPPPPLRVTSEFDSDCSAYFHKISCKLLENLAKLKVTFQNNSKGEVVEPQLSFVSKYLLLDYDLEEQNALIKGSIDLGPGLLLRATRDVKIDPVKYKSITSGFGVLLKEQGVRGFFRGWVPTLYNDDALGLYKGLVPLWGRQIP